MDLNKVFLLGRLGRDPELKTFSDPARSMVTFTVATGDYNRKTKKTTTTWHNCIAWDKIAENIHKYIKKGKQVFIEGEIRQNIYEDKEGKKHYGINIVVRTITMTDGSKQDMKEGDDNISPVDKNKEKEYVNYSDPISDDLP
jgi:single-strand DNA-binding protein